MLNLNVRKKYLLTYASNEDSNQPAHPRSLTEAFRCVNEHFLSLAIQGASSEDSDQPARMRRLIWIYAGRTYSKVCFSTYRLILSPASSCDTQLQQEDLFKYRNVQTDPSILYIEIYQLNQKCFVLIYLVDSFWPRARLVSVQVKFFT